MLTLSSSGETVELRVGERLAVRLARQGGFSWHPATAAGSVLARVYASGGYPGEQPATAVFRAVAPGEATLSATDDIPCLHSVPRCLPPQRVWRVTVRVGR